MFFHPMGPFVRAATNSLIRAGHIGTAEGKLSSVSSPFQQFIDKIHEVARHQKLVQMSEQELRSTIEIVISELEKASRLAMETGIVLDGGAPFQKEIDDIKYALEHMSF